MIGSITKNIVMLNLRLENMGVAINAPDNPPDMTDISGTLTLTYLMHPEFVTQTVNK